ncbi:MAG: nucleoside triphosphate pyrophosphohydrolase [Myxococcota bacterium]
MADKSFGEAFQRLCDVMDKLRENCPWDKVQTLETLKPYLLEETHEVLHAMDTGDSAAHQEELGDLVFQVVFHARVRSEEPGGFTVADVCNGIADKLIRRHPHVFGPEAGHGATKASVRQSWEALKAQERAGKSALHGVPPSLPALARAQKVGEKAARVGFDWENADHVLQKVEEELGELKDALRHGNREHVRAEMGDLLFSVAQLARFVEHNAEDALRETIGRFSRRFQYVERRLRESGKTPESAGMEELERLWGLAKQAEKQGQLDS